MAGKSVRIEKIWIKIDGIKKMAGKTVRIERMEIKSLKRRKLWGGFLE